MRAFLPRKWLSCSIEVAPANWLRPSQPLGWGRPLKDPLPFLPYSEHIFHLPPLQDTLCDLHIRFVLCKTFYASFFLSIWSGTVLVDYVKWKCQYKLPVSNNRNHYIQQPDLNDGTLQFFTFTSFLWKLILLKTLPLTRWPSFLFLKRTYFDLIEKILTLLALET